MVWRGPGLTTTVVFAATADFHHACFFRVFTILAAIIAVGFRRAIAGGMFAFRSLLIGHDHLPQLKSNEVILELKCNAVKLSDMLQLVGSR